MEAYRKMYAILCAAASDAIDLLDEEKNREARQLLQSALLKAEEIYLEDAVRKETDYS